ncbi:MAG: nucleotidyltransferase domain-containing protein [Candidatus Cloacimonetes bacterium]|jgi:predicted nucleotidyltransferase|nr:nucleotidyltransferase domain-containing protein [Candidatus Cloacimonadota bacterium]
MPLTNKPDWQWRFKIAEKICSCLDFQKFDVKGFYIFGSVKNATAGPASDIDILIHFCGNKKQEDNLLMWLDGWSQALAEINKQKTGYSTDGLLDVHLVTDEDIKNKTSFAVKIGAISDAARPLKVID